MTRPKPSEAGFTLIEMLVTVIIVGIAFAIFVGGVGSALLTSDYHRKQANVQASVRNFAESLKSNTGAATYANCATTATYVDAYSPSPPTRENATTAGSGVSHTAASVAPARRHAALLLFYALANGSTFTAPASAVERWDIASTGGTPANRVTAAFDDESLTTTADTGSRMATSADAGASVAHAIVLAAANPAAANGVVRRGISTAATSGASTLTLAKPAGTLAGDAMVAHIAVRGGSATTVTPPAGWLQVAKVDSGTSIKSLVFERTATSANVLSYTWTFSGSPEAVGGVVSYGGVARKYTATITAVQYWNGTTFVASCPTPDEGLQKITLRVTADDGRDHADVDIIKRRP